MKNDGENHSENIIMLSKENYDILLSKNKELILENSRLNADHEHLKHELEKLKRMIFGSKSERFIPSDPGQLSLDIVSQEQEAKRIEEENISYTRKKSKKTEKPGHSRLPLPAHLPRKEYTIEPEENITGAKKIGEEITEILEYKPGKLYVKKYIRPKYLLPQKEENNLSSEIVIGLLPSFPIPRGNAGPELLTHLFISKYVDHLPFYRQIQQFQTS